MGYNTNFTGRFTFSKPLTPEQVLTLSNFCETRHEPESGWPSYYCQWVSRDGTGLEWDESEKFYSYVEWLEELIAHFFVPWGTAIDGEVRWMGEEFGDAGVIYASNNKIKAVRDVPGRL